MPAPVPVACSRPRWPALALTAALLLGAVAGGGPGAATAAPTSTSYNSGAFFFPPYPSDADRLGVAGSAGNYPLALGAGWYQDWGASLVPAHPGALAYARTIYFRVNTNDCGLDKQPATLRSQVTADISTAALLTALAAHPGALWIVGNEPDSIYNCSPIMPAVYAELYHEYATLIRAHADGRRAPEQRPRLAGRERCADGGGVRGAISGAAAAGAARPAVRPPSGGS